MAFELIEYEDLRGDRPLVAESSRPQRNAQSEQMLTELDAAFAQAVADPTVRCIVLAGRGEHFSAGHDLKEAQAKRADFTVEDRWAYESRVYLDYCLRIWDCPKPTDGAACRAPAVAGGFMVANMCDLIVACEDAYLRRPGLPDPGGRRGGGADPPLGDGPACQAKEMPATRAAGVDRGRCAARWAWSTGSCPAPSWTVQR